MNAPAPLSPRTERSLASARRVVLILLCVCALGTVARSSGTPHPLPSGTDSLATTLVVLLALGAITTRQIAAGRVRPQTRARCLFAAYSFAAGVGIAGLLLAQATGDVLRGLGYVLAGAIFALAGLRVSDATPKRSPR
jgi:hypothetical protein